MLLSSFPLLVIFLLNAVPLIASECSMPDRYFKNGRIIYKNFEDSNLTTVSENYVLSFRCNKGYVRDGSRFLLCEKDGWSDRLPKCLFLYCGEPPRIASGRYEGDKRAVGSVVEYKCDSGFEFLNENETSLVCLLNSTFVQWSGELPVCVERRTCPDPSVSNNGYRSGPCCFTGNILRYTCNSGFKLVGERQITCLHGGVWSEKRPRCEPDRGHCPDPPFIANGSVKRLSDGDYTEVYEEVEVVCDPGYLYYGEFEYIMCLEDLQWEMEFGECVETFCGPPEVPANGNILELTSSNASMFPQKFEVTYNCDEGYRLIGDIYRSCDSGNWTGLEPRCEPITCHNPGQPEYGNRNGDDFRIGQKVIFSCFRGYNLIGSVERYCMKNGKWSGELTRCNLKSNFCPDPGIPINGQKIGNNYNEGDSVRFRCYPGFSLIGDEVRICQSNREWSGMEVNCLGAYDFDDTGEVSDTLKLMVNRKAEEQAKEISNLNARINSFSMDGGAVQISRILDINFPGRLILYFVFDVSGSVKLHNFETSIKFAKALVKKISISKNGARAGALTFSSKAVIEFFPVQYSTTKEVVDALDRIEYRTGGTATSSALKLVREEAMPLTREVLGRIGLKSIIFILTDGKVNTGGDPEEQAEKLKDAGVEIYCIGITGDIVANTLHKIASKPLDEHVFILNSYNTLEWLIQEITNGTIDYSECGLGLDRVGRNFHAKIAGGQSVVEPWPWMAALFISKDKRQRTGQLKCGGSIVGKQWILTAAHCLCIKKEAIPLETSQVVVRLGLTNIDNFTHLQEFESERFFIHEQFNPQNMDNDIALIKLNGFIHYNAYVRPICVPQYELPQNTSLYQPEANAFATGWGHNEVVQFGEIVVSRALKDLKELQLPIQSRDRCLKSLLTDGGQMESFTERMICAGSGEGGTDTCTGDSGGPLMQSQFNNHSNVFWTQVGVVSWGRGCARPNTYGYYTKLQNFSEWLKNIMNSNKD